MELRLLKKPDGSLVLQYRSRLLKPWEACEFGDDGHYWSQWKDVPTVEEKA